MTDICPVCRITVLSPHTIASWRGQDVCCWCHADLTSADAEQARRALAEPRLTPVTLHLTPREP